MSTTEEYAPVEEMGSLQSQIRELRERTREDRTEMRDRLGKLDDRLGRLDDRVDSVDKTVGHLDKTMSLGLKFAISVMVSCTVALLIGIMRFAAK